MQKRWNESAKWSTGSFCVGKWSKATVGKGARFAALMMDVDQSLGQEMGAQCKMNHCRVQNQGESSIALSQKGKN
jgi:hypothetical protein